MGHTTMAKVLCFDIGIRSLLHSNESVPVAKINFVSIVFLVLVILVHEHGVVLWLKFADNGAGLLVHFGLRHSRASAGGSADLGSDTLVQSIDFILLTVPSLGHDSTFKFVQFSPSTRLCATGAANSRFGRDIVFELIELRTSRRSSRRSRWGRATGTILGKEIIFQLVKAGTGMCAGARRCPGLGVNVGLQLVELSAGSRDSGGRGT
mmetsp:Transcript_36600/g.54568  ORF Transcript_36600/g.54568 Transcript_36600/m.54568 type:complete len:208 (-) Transcript_36600:1360-1983(-)